MAARCTFMHIYREAVSSDETSVFQSPAGNCAPLMHLYTPSLGVQGNPLDRSIDRSIYFWSSAGRGARRHLAAQWRSPLSCPPPCTWIPSVGIGHETPLSG